MMMFPARTVSPPYFLTPRYCGLLSRPFRLEPTPFLCAMDRSDSAECDVVDLHFREALPMALLLRVVLAALHLEHDHLVALSVTDDLAGDLRPFQDGRAGVHFLPVGAEEHLIEGDLGAHFGFERRDLERLPGFSAELEAGGPDDGVVHDWDSCQTSGRA